MAASIQLMFMLWARWLCQLDTDLGRPAVFSATRWQQCTGSFREAIIPPAATIASRPPVAGAGRRQGGHEQVHARRHGGRHHPTEETVNTP